jgi:uncharacterized membrane protein YdjX (TVP38/TMEM64 family)
MLIAAVVALSALYYWLQATGNLGVFSSKDTFKAWLQSLGAWADAVFFLLQLAQVLIAFIPGEVTGVAGGIALGFWRAMAIGTLGIATGSLIAFLLARKFGRPLVVRLAGGSVIDKYMDTVNRNSVWLLFAMFLLPFFPKDALSYVAGLTGIACPVFFIISFIGRLPGQVVSTLVGSGMISIPWWGWGIIALASGGLVYLSFRYSERISDWLMGVLKGNPPLDQEASSSQALPPSQGGQETAGTSWSDEHKD